MRFRASTDSLLLYGFGKNEQANIDGRELAALQKLASALLAMTRVELEGASAGKELEEIADEAHEKESDFEGHQRNRARPPLHWRARPKDDA